MSTPQKLIRIDLSETEIPQPCAKHAKRGFQADCEDCEDTDPLVGVIEELRGKFVEIRNPNVLPYGETKEIFNPLNDEETVGAFKERMATKLITAWNVVDAETGDELPIPRDDASSLNRAVDVVNPVYAAVVKARKERAVPKGSATSS